MDISKFLKVYSNLPDKLRDQIVVVVDEKTYTWNAAYFEINSQTELGKKILEKLVQMDII